MEILTAFGIGLVGSLHCIGMCGPIALAIPIRNNKWLSIIMYNMGRIATYSLLGLIFGFIGKGFALAGIQQYLSITSGALIIAIAIISISSVQIKLPSIYQNTISPIRKYFSYLFNQNTYTSLFLIGILNGVLPCGLIYMAVIGSIATGDPISGSLFMLAFGLGTIPAMLSLGILREMLTNSLRFKINKTLPFITLALGCLLVVRGMNLGIPFLSPKANIENSITHCCHK